MRMPAGWTLVGTNDLSFESTETKRDKVRREQKFRNAIHNIVERSIEQMQEDSEKSYSAQKDTENKLLQAYNDKKLKSKNLIKKAKSLKKEKNAVATA